MRQFVSITKALADENRIRTIMFLRHGELCACQVIELLQLAPSTVSKHLSILQQAGLVDACKKGRWRYFKLPAADAPKAAKAAVAWVVKSLEDDPQIARDDQRLRGVMKKNITSLCALYKN